MGPRLASSRRLTSSLDSPLLWLRAYDRPSAGPLELVGVWSSPILSATFPTLAGWLLME
jgi:hypothetical protein